MATEKELSRLERDLAPLYYAEEFDSQAILDKEGQIKAHQDGLKRLKELKKELFPSAK